MLDLKKKIELQEKIPVKLQKLLYVGKMLSNSNELSAYNIQKHSTLSFWVSAF